jgi:hypothetical protein
MRFDFDPLGGSPAGCHAACTGDGNCLPSTCRQRYITSQGPVGQVSRSVWKKDIAFSGTLGSSLDELFGQDTHAGSIFSSATVFWHYSGALYIRKRTVSPNVFVQVGQWSDTIPDYAQFVIDFNPCNNTITYSYGNPPVVVFSEAYGFTPPYGDVNIDLRPATTDTSFASTDHYPETIDIDNFEVTNTPCGEACCDQDTGTCTDVAKGACAFKTVYPNTLCAMLGTPGYPPVCAIPTGSCCDKGPRAGGACTNGVLEADCQGAQLNWVKGGACTDVVAFCHIATGSCGGLTGCDNFPNVGKKCFEDAECNGAGFCYAGLCSPASLPGTCEYASLGFCQGMGSCVGGPLCNPDTGANCCDNGCSPPVLCPSGIPGDCQGKADCDSVPNGFDCAFCEGCDPWPAVACATDAGCPSPGGGLPQGTCVPNPPVGCNIDADCPSDTPARTCRPNKGGKAGALCLTDADCSIEASPCVEHTGACCEYVKGTCLNDVLDADCKGTQETWFKQQTCTEVEAAGLCDAHLGACCDEDTFGGCTQTTENGCDCPKCVFYKQLSCADITCIHRAIPTVSEWGIAVLTLLLLIGAKVYFGRRQAAAA